MGVVKQMHLPANTLHLHSADLMSGLGRRWTNIRPDPDKRKQKNCFVYFDMNYFKTYWA